MNNAAHPMEKHDMTSVDDQMRRVIGGESLENKFNCCILPP